jgi:hypothetical protein
MALLDDLFKGNNVVTGLAIGIGAAVLGPMLLPVLAGAAKPLVKAAIKGGIVLYEKGKETAAEMGEVLEDIVAEAKAEVAAEHEQAIAVTPVPEEQNV